MVRPGFVSPQTIAAALNVSEQTIRLWLRKEKIIGSKFGGEWEVSEKEYERILSNRPISDVVTEEELSKYLEVGIEEIRSLCDKRLMPFIFDGKNYFFTKDAIENWLKSLVKKLLEEVTRNG